MHKFLITLAALLLLATPAHAKYVQAPVSGMSAFLAIDWVKHHESKGNILMFPGRCVSACAIAWAVAKRKCVINRPDIMLEQHSHAGNGEKINVRSKSKQYWLRLGRLGQPSSTYVRWYEPAKTCPSAEANRDSFKHKGLRPKVF